MSTGKLSSTTLERHALGGLINNPQVYYDICNFATYEDFSSTVYQNIYIIISQRLESKKQVDKTLIAQDLVSLGIKLKDDLNMFDFIEGISFTEINEQGTIEAFHNLSSLRLKRKLAENLKKAFDYVTNSADKSIEDVVAESDRIYNSSVEMVVKKETSKNIFDNLEDNLNSQKVVTDIGFLTEYKNFNNLYGGLRPGNLYAIVARPEQGKSTFLCDMAFGISKVSNFKVKVLYLDTENFSNDIKYRILASLSGVPFWHIETGNWKTNKSYVDRINKAVLESKKYEFHHYEVGNKNIEQIRSLCRRWHSKHVGRSGNCVIVYDYIKLTGDEVGDNWSEHQAIGDKIDKLKKLGEELNAVILTAAQANRMGENTNRKVSGIVDDSSIISLSDRLLWFASFVAILRRKYIEELQQDGIQYGTHKLIKLKGRFQGKESAGHVDLIRKPIGNGKFIYVKDYMNFDITNFKVTEKGTLLDMLNNPIEPTTIDSL